MNVYEKFEVLTEAGMEFETYKLDYYKLCYGYSVFGNYNLELLINYVYNCYFEDYDYNLEMEFVS